MQTPLDYLLAYHCAPALAGIKSASLVSCDHTRTFRHRSSAITASSTRAGSGSASSAHVGAAGSCLSTGKRVWSGRSPPPGHKQCFRRRDTLWGCLRNCCLIPSPHACGSGTDSHMRSGCFWGIRSRMSTASSNTAGKTVNTPAVGRSTRTSTARLHCLTGTGAAAAPFAEGYPTGTPSSRCSARLRAVPTSNALLDGSPSQKMRKKLFILQERSKPHRFCPARSRKCGFTWRLRGVTYHLQSKF